METLNKNNVNSFNDDILEVIEFYTGLDIENSFKSDVEISYNLSYGITVINIKDSFVEYSIRLVDNEVVYFEKVN